MTLQTSHRFSEAGGIGRLADAIRAGDADAVINLIDDSSLPDIERFEVDSIDGVRGRLIEASRSVHREIEGTAEPQAKLDRMGLYRVLCAHRRGPLGVEALCAVLDETAAAERHTTRRTGSWATLRFRWINTPKTSFVKNFHSALLKLRMVRQPMILSVECRRDCFR